MKNSDLSQKITAALSAVQKPGRYVGGEWGQIAPKPDAELRFALCFPDTYEIGMSHLGLRILYALANRRDDCSCERVFAPWMDMEQAMSENKIPLFSLESQTPVADFDIIGFTLQYELSYTNVLNLLDLAGLPIHAAERTSLSPLVIAGGPCACNPEPLADFIDLFVLGEGEEVLDELLDLFKTHKRQGSDKAEFLSTAALLDGIYVPSLYDITYNADGTIAAITPKNNAPANPRKRAVADLDNMFAPTETIVPYLETVHDRAVGELFRGCIRGCRFCQAGYLYRPIREKSPETIDAQCRSQCTNSGYDELSLCSLSTSDYSQLPELLESLLSWTEKERTNLSLPSLRMDNFPPDLMERLQSVRRSSLTFAPEAGTQRLRDVINKNLTEDEVLHTARQAFAGGWTAVKLYFMMGLPTETDEDIKGIAALAQAVVDEYYRNPNKPKGKAVRVNMSCACFVPKPFTPFQWEAQATLAELEEKQKLLRDSLTTRKVTIGRHNAKMGLLEGVFARGDRRLGAVLERAWRAGSRFESWDEHFDFVRWQEAFASAGLDMAFYANRRREYSEILPWSHLDFGLHHDFLIHENQRAHLAKTTPNCREQCSGCGARCKRQEAGGKKIESKAVHENEMQAVGTTYRPIRLWLKKSGVAIYTSHLDMNRLLSRAVRRAALPLWYTEGFNPHPYLTFLLPLPLGQSGGKEPVDIRIIGDMQDDEIFNALNNALPPDVCIVEVSTPVHKAKEIAAASYKITADFGDSETAAAFVNSVSKIISGGELISEKRSKRGLQTVNLCDFIREWSIQCNGSSIEILCTLDAGSTRNLNAQLLWDALCNSQCTVHNAQLLGIARIALLCADGSEFC